MKSIRILSAFLTLTALQTNAFAQSTPVFETVVEDVMFNTSNRTIIDEKTIRESRAPNITTLLSAQANVTVTNTPFQPNSIFLRGGDAGHILILVDGVPFYDASTTQRTFNLNSMDVKSVRRIEIIKGAQTVLYGGQALSGIIKIETIPAELKQQSSLQGQIGTHNTKDLAFTHTELIEDNRALLFRGQGSWRDNQSPVLDSSKNYARNSLNGEMAYAWKAAVEGHVKGHFLQDRNWSPTSGMNYRVQDADDFEQFTRQLGAAAYLKFNELPWNPRLNLGAQNSVRQFKHPVPPFPTDQDYGANLQSVRLDVTPFKNDIVQIHSGLSYLNEHFVYRNNGNEIADSYSDQKGLFTKADFTFSQNFEVSAGGRVESWADKDAIGTYQVGVTIYKNTKIEHSTGYKIPSMFQLYSDYGNPELKEEKSSQWLITQDFPINESQHLSISLFDNEFSNLIVTRGSYPNLKYQNVKKSTSRGFEVSYNLKSSDVSSWLFAYGYQEPRDGDNDSWLIRRPLVSGSIRYMFNSRPHSASVELIGSGTRVDSNSNTTTTTLPGYAVAHASYSYQFDDYLTLYGRVNNIANYRYQESYSYYSEGTSGHVGFEYNF